MKNHFPRVLLVALPALLLTACQTEIQHGLNEKEANEILVLLERKGIPTAKLKEEGGRELTWKISVSKNYAANAMMILKENELPRQRNSGFELFNKGSLIPTATEERAMYLQALAGELAKSLSSIEGVLDARVHINIPQTDELADRSARPEPSASVLIKYRSYLDEGKKAPPPPVTEEQIKQLVAPAVQDLSPKNVQVVLTPAAMPGGVDSTPILVDMLGIRMARESLGPFRLLLGSAVFVIFLEALYIVIATFRGSGGGAKARVRPEL